MPITATIPTTLDFPHRGELERDDFVLAQETAQDLLAGDFTTKVNLFATQANTLEENVTNLEASTVASANLATSAANYKGEWNSTTNYLVGQSVSYNGGLYLVKENNINQIPTNTTYWLINSLQLPIDSIAILKTVSNIPTVNVLGYYTKGDGGGGTFYWDSTSTETDNGGTVIKPDGYTDLVAGRWKRPIDETIGNVKKWGAKGDGITNDSTSILNAVSYVYNKALSISSNVPTGSSNFYASLIDLYFPLATYKISTSIVMPSKPTDRIVNIKFISDGARVIGNNNILIDFSINHSANKIEFDNFYFDNFSSIVKYDTGNKNESFLKFNKCFFTNITGTAIDTVSYSASRSSMLMLKSCIFSENTAKALSIYTDHFDATDCWFYGHSSLNTETIYLSGDCNASFNSCFFIPHPNLPLNTDSCFIKYVGYSAESTQDDSSLKFLNVSNCRASIEGIRGFIKVYTDYNLYQPEAERNESWSISIDNSYVACGGSTSSIIEFVEGYCPIVSLKNTKSISSNLVSVRAGNTQPPKIPTYATKHITMSIIIDEMTRASNGFGNKQILPTNLMPFYYDITPQTSKYQMSIPGDINYRIPSVVATTLTNTVKATIPFNFPGDNVTNANPLTFMVVTVSDASGSGISPVYSASATALVSIIGANNSGATRYELVKTVIHDARGYISNSVSAAPLSIHFGTGDTGNSYALPSLNDGTQNNITITWLSKANTKSWAYIIPLSGIRDNQAWLMQNNVW